MGSLIQMNFKDVVPQISTNISLGTAGDSDMRYLSKNDLLCVCQMKHRRAFSTQLSLSRRSTTDSPTTISYIILNAYLLENMGSSSTVDLFGLQVAWWSVSKSLGQLISEENLALLELNRFTVLRGLALNNGRQLSFWSHWVWRWRAGNGSWMLVFSITSLSSQWADRKGSPLCLVYGR